ncbi:MAG: hypothetical protein KTR25_20705 [Myxococcales bacterium]|nr:hypothetical protein [Myxococcales bacterium]
MEYSDEEGAPLAYSIYGRRSRSECFTTKLPEHDGEAKSTGSYVLPLRSALRI